MTEIRGIDNKLYWAIRDDIVYNLDTAKTINLIVDLFGNIIDSYEELKNKDKKLFEEMIEYIEGEIKWIKKIK